MTVWQLQEAKARLSEIVKLCSSEGPQILIVQGEEVVLMSKAEYDKLTGKKPNFIEFMRNSPLYGVNLVIERDKSTPKE